MQPPLLLGKEGGAAGENRGRLKRISSAAPTAEPQGFPTGYGKNDTPRHRAPAALLADGDAR